MKMPDFNQWARKIKYLELQEGNDLVKSIEISLKQSFEQGRALGQREGEEAMRLKLTKEYL